MGQCPKEKIWQNIKKNFKASPSAVDMKSEGALGNGFACVKRDEMCAGDTVL